MSVCTVSVSGLVTGVTAGTSSVTATFASVTSSIDSVTVTSGVTPIVTLPVLGVDVPDHVAAALGRLLEQDKNKPNITALMTALVTPTQAVESALWQLLTQQRVATAIGTQLDALGKLVGIARNGLTDATYQTYVLAQIATNISRGRPVDLIAIVKTAINNSSATIGVSLQAPCCVVLRIGAIATTDVVGTAIYGFVQAAAEAGVRVVLQWSNYLPSATFTFDTGLGWNFGHLASAVG